MTLEEIAFRAAERALDKQEALLQELRARTGVLLAAASLAASFLGGPAFAERAPAGLALAALTAFLVTVGASLYALTPRSDFTLAISGPELYASLFAFRDDIGEVHRRLAHNLQEFWRRNDTLMRKIVRAYRVAAAALVLEIALLAASVSGTLVT